MTNQWTRRDFLRTSGVTLGSAACLGLGAPTWLRAAVDGPTRTDRTLVLVQLTGGNDGLNTVVPVDHDPYHRARPTLALPRGQTLPLGDGFALHPSLSELRELFDDGRMTVLHGVGYPQPNRSHFRSLDIWHSAAPDDLRPETGWIGRLADQHGTDDQHLAVRFGGRDLPLALIGRNTAAPCIEKLDDWRLDLGSRPDARRRTLEAVHARDRSGASADLEFIRRVGQRAFEESTDLAARPAPDAGSFPNTALGRSFALASTFIDSASRPRVVFVTHGGFDTHARQAEPHASLLRQLSVALGAFMADLERRTIARDVLVCVYSEFGRRVAENASGGTDHGAAQPVLLLSPTVTGGLAGTFPSFDDLDAGDLRHTTDFRQLYATLLDDWLKLPAAPILGDDFERLRVLRS